MRTEVDDTTTIGVTDDIVDTRWVNESNGAIVLGNLSTEVKWRLSQLVLEQVDALVRTIK